MIKNEEDLLKSTGFESFGQLARALYRDVACGPWLERTPNGVMIGSIVEGVEECASPIELVYPFKLKKLWKAADRVNKEAIEIWNRTHGCETCHALASWGEPQTENYEDVIGMVRVVKDCPECGGQGAII